MLTPVSSARSFRTVAIPTTVSRSASIPNTPRGFRNTPDRLRTAFRSCVGRFGQGKSVLRFGGRLSRASRGWRHDRRQPRQQSTGQSHVQHRLRQHQQSRQSGGHGVNQTVVINAVEVNSHAVDLQLHLWSATGHRLPDDHGSQLRRIVCPSPGPANQHQRRAGWRATRHEQYRSGNWTANR